MKTNGKANGMHIKIEKGIPMPLGKSNSITSQLRALKIGDSAFLPGKTLRQASNHFVGAFGRGCYVSRTVDGGVRVWRTG